ncbi:SDR family oxidoreductase [Ktedonospora formicarum]|uniref:Nucleotide-diphosphate-sugar epimerase n=1 Tax=Ktedonospora formicarum TaxID=2778364 RepID=A0A8J3I894_9CHLR|nr:NAD(P)H-binding protein [Ktedonospora formicarum]GHO51329.1 nucleotide-diphosphate-sugar epimerase [Ktedonospora formicarum]
MLYILLTGATGTLGQQVANALRNHPNITTRLMSRRVFAPGGSEGPRPYSRVSLRRFSGYGVPADQRQEIAALPFPAVSWVQADLKSGAGLSDAVHDIDVIIHCAGDPRRLLEAARATKVSHIVYISIVACDRIPLSYYQQKVAEEEAIKASGIAWSILRATQFHALIDLFLRRCSLLPWITPLPSDLLFQSIAECEVGRRMAELALASPTREIEEMGGPQVLSLGEMAYTWYTLRHVHRKLLPLWIPGQVAAGYRRGDNTCGGELPHGEITWAQWVQQSYQSSPPTQTRVAQLKDKRANRV